MSSFRVPCPSCEAKVTVASEKLVGTKIECPKCKYRFKVEAPAESDDADAADAPPADKADKGKDKKDAKSKDAKGKDKDKPKDAEKGKDKKEKGKKGADDGGKKGGKKKANKKLIAVVAGGVAVVLLVVVGVVGFGGGGGGGGKPKTPVAKGGGLSRPAPVPGQQQPTDPDDPDAKKPEDKKPAVAAPAKLVASDRDPTNLLPGGSRAVYRVDMDRLRQSPYFGMVFDQTVRDVFAASMGFGIDAVATYLHAVADPGRSAFGVVRLSAPVSDRAVLDRLDLVPGSESQVNGRTYRVIRSNPFLSALGRSVTPGTLLGDAYAQLPDGWKGKDSAEPLAVCVYDTQTLLFADSKTMHAFLASLGADGYPPFQSEYRGGPASAKKDAPKDDPTGAPAAKAPPKKDAEKRPITSFPTFRSIEPTLKEVLNNFESDDRPSPVLLYAEKLDKFALPTDGLKPTYRPAARVLAGVVAAAQYVGLRLSALTDQQVSAQAVAWLPTDVAASTAARTQLVPALTVGVPLLGEWLNTPMAFRFLNAAPGTATDPANPLPAGEAPATPLPGDPAAPAAPGGPAAQPVNAASKVELSVNDRVVTLNVEFAPEKQVYLDTLAPRAFTLATQLRGRFQVVSGEFGWQGLAAGVEKVTVGGRPFPRGTADRPATDPVRQGMPYPPATRVSFFADLLPFLNRGGLAARVDPAKAWYDPANVPAAEEWVPELLSPDYPQSAWRATSPYAAGRPLGGTNYVAVAGLGRDAARYDPADPAFAKKVGITGYDWGSKPDEITDGMANTVYLLRVPPGVSRPWLAGGGATVMGVNEASPTPAMEFAAPRAGSKPGTYALMADGSVRWVAGDVDARVFRAMATRAGGETIEDFERAAPKLDPKKGQGELTAGPGPKAKPSEPAPKAAAPGAKEVAPEPKGK